MKTTISNKEVSQTIQPKANKQASANTILQAYKNKTAQRQSVDEEELLQGKFATVQKMDLDEEELLQGKFETAQLATEDEQELLQRKPNNTGLPDNLKNGIENLSGYSMDDVKVHYNSSQPATLQAHAYAQGTDIHIAPRQEKHLPHEAWHVIQQKQGRVKPTMQMKGTVQVNDDIGLEKEADVMGANAAFLLPQDPKQTRGVESKPDNRSMPVQRTIMKGTRALSTRNIQQIMLREFISLQRREPNDEELAELNRLVNRYSSTDREIRTVERIIEEVINSSRSPDLTNSNIHRQSTSQSQINMNSIEQQLESGIPSQQYPVESSVQSVSESTVLENNEPSRELPNQGLEHVETPRERSEEHQAQIGRSTIRTDYDLSDVPVMNQDTETHLGFEIELARNYRFPGGSSGLLHPLINRTLFRCTIEGNTILEMLLDDVREEGATAIAQVEFRTPPLRFTDINRTLQISIRSAISSFPMNMLSEPRSQEFLIRGERQRGRWEPTQLTMDNQQLLQRGSTNSRFTPPSGDLAQHVTTSIELSAFSRLGVEQQRLLFPNGQGVSSKQGLLDAIATRATGNIDATTTGRNREEIMVKTPVESIIAADPSLQIPLASQNSGSVNISAEDQFNLIRVEDTVNRIRETGTYPSMQGEQEQGYRAVAEKLQPPLEDSVSGELRVLVEHRTGEFRRAVNDALANNSNGSLSRYQRAAREMDRQRSVRRSFRNPSDRQDTDLSIIASQTNSRQEIIGEEVVPNIPNPEIPMILTDLVVYYGNGIEWGNGFGTYSNEFLEFRDNLDNSINILIQGGLDPVEASVFSDRIQHQMSLNVLNGVQSPHPPAELQENIFDAVNEIGTQLWGLLRYLNRRQ